MTPQESGLKILRLERRLLRAIKPKAPTLRCSKLLQVGSKYSYHPNWHDLSLTFTYNGQHVVVVLRFQKEHVLDDLETSNGNIVITVTSPRATLRVRETKPGHQISILATTVLEMAQDSAISKSVAQNA